MTATRLTRIQEHLWPKGYRRDMWMVVDAARDRRIFGLLLECFYLQHHCLFSGRIAPDLSVVAPYLVQLDYDDRNTQNFISQAWGQSWGVFLKSDTSPESLKRHLRTLLLVRDEAGHHLIFRYYDPRVLRIYLPTCRADELRAVFGPIERFFVEDEMPDVIMEFAFDQNLLVDKKSIVAT